MAKTFLNGRVSLWEGDCLDVLQGLEADSFDSCVTDPPYHLTSIVKRFGNPNSAEAQFGSDGAYRRASAGFMGKAWDGGDIAFRPETWAAVLRVLKPGAHLVAFAAPKNSHRLACAIEDGGFEIRDTICWLFGSGFPKSHDVSKGIDRAAGAEREVVGDYAVTREFKGREYVGDESRATRVNITIPATDAGREWQGWGTALKPAHESLIVAQKPLEFWAEYNTIGSQLAQLESRLWSMLSVRIAASNFGLSPSEFDAACASAQWSAGERNNTLADLSGQMATSRFVSALISSLNTASSWKAIWDGGSQSENRSTTETALSTTTDLRTLKFALSRITPVTIIQAHRSGLWSIASASTAERVFDATVRQLSATLESHALATAIEQYRTASLGADVRPNFEPIVLARKPFNGTIAANVLKHGTGAINVDGCRVATVVGDYDHPGNNGIEGKRNVYGDFANGNQSKPHANGRWPANVIHDGSDEVVEAFPDNLKSGDLTGQPRTENNIYGSAGATLGTPQFYTGDSGSAARFFYTAKADSDDRIGSKHPTVKPLDLMQYLVRLITPPKGTILDPFAGTGTTAEAAWREGLSAVLIEREAEYIADIERRMSLALAGPDERARESIKARLKDKPQDHGPLFEGVAI